MDIFGDPTLGFLFPSLRQPASPLSPQSPLPEGTADFSRMRALALFQNAARPDAHRNSTYVETHAAV